MAGEDFLEGRDTERTFELNARAAFRMEPFNAPLDGPITGEPERDAILTGYTIGNWIEAAASVR